MRMMLDEKVTKEKMGEEAIITKKYKFKTETEVFEFKVSGSEDAISNYEDYIEVTAKKEHQQKVTE